MILHSACGGGSEEKKNDKRIREMEEMASGKRNEDGRLRIIRYN